MGQADVIATVAVRDSLNLEQSRPFPARLPRFGLNVRYSSAATEPAEPTVSPCKVYGYLKKTAQTRRASCCFAR